MLVRRLDASRVAAAKVLSMLHALASAESSYAHSLAMVARIDMAGEADGASLRRAVRAFAALPAAVADSHVHVRYLPSSFLLPDRSRLPPFLHPRVMLSQRHDCCPVFVGAGCSGGHHGDDAAGGARVPRRVRRRGLRLRALLRQHGGRAPTAEGHLPGAPGGLSRGGRHDAGPPAGPRSAAGGGGSLAH